MPISHAFVFLACLPRPQSPRSPPPATTMTDPHPSPSPSPPLLQRYRLSCIPFFLVRFLGGLLFAFCILFILRVARASRRHHRLTDNFNQHQRHRADSRLWTYAVRPTPLPQPHAMCHTVYAVRHVPRPVRVSGNWSSVEVAGFISFQSRFFSASLLWVLKKLPALGGVRGELIVKKKKMPPGA